MSNIICKKGNFVLCYKTFIDERDVTTHDIEICRLSEDCSSRYTIANWIFSFSSGCYELRSVSDRLLDNLKTCEDLEDVKSLSLIGEGILSTEVVKLEK